MPAETPDPRPTTDPGTPAHVAAGASNGATTDDALVFLPRNDGSGTVGLIEVGALRALIGYVEQRDGVGA